MTRRGTAPSAHYASLKPNGTGATALLGLAFDDLDHSLLAGGVIRMYLRISAMGRRFAVAYTNRITHVIEH